MLAAQVTESSSSLLTPCLIEQEQVETLELIQKRWLAALVYS